MEDSEVEIGFPSANVATLVARMRDDSMVDLSLNFTSSDRFCPSSSTLPKLEELFSSPLTLLSGSTEEVEMIVGLGCKFVVDVVVAATELDNVLPLVAFCISLADFFGSITEDSEVDPGTSGATVTIPLGWTTDDSWVGCTLPGLFDSVVTMAADSDRGTGDFAMDTAT